MDLSKVETALRTKLEDWKALLRRQVPQARQVLKKLLAGPIVFTAHREGQRRFYEFTVRIALGRVVTGLAMCKYGGVPNATADFVSDRTARRVN